MKTPKFHQTLHVIDCINRHGCLVNYDDLISENLGNKI